MATPPLLSVIIPARNAAASLDAAIRSVRAQGREDLEVLVIDDGSTDETFRVAEKSGPPVRVLTSAGRGAAAARNIGIAEARGSYLAFLDADDEWAAGKLTAQIEALDGCEELVLVCADAWIGLPRRDGSRECFLEGRRPLRPDRDHLLLDNWICTSTVVTRTEAVRKAGGFREELLVAHDYDLWLRLLERGDALVLDEALALYDPRQGSAGLSADTWTTLHETARVLRGALERGAPSDSLSDSMGRRLFWLEYVLGHLALDREDLPAALHHLSELHPRDSGAFLGLGPRLTLWLARRAPETLLPMKRVLNLLRVRTGDPPRAVP